MWKNWPDKTEWNEEYDIMMLMMGTMQFTSWTVFREKIWKNGQRVSEQYKPWLKERHPEIFKEIDNILDLDNKIVEVDKAIPKMWDLIEEEIDTNKIARMYRDSVITEMQGKSSEKIRKLLDAMEDDLMVTRAVTMQACMLAVTGYFQSIQKRVKEWKEIYTKEFKVAYEILKTEMGEPTSIKESRVKNLQVSLEVPVNKEDIKRILDSDKNQDLAIEVAPEFQHKIDEKFNLNK